MTDTVIGLDISLTSTGVVVLSEKKLEYATSLPTKGLGGKPKGDMRLVSLASELRSILYRYRPLVAVIEDLPRGAHGANHTALAHGVIRAILAEHGIGFVTVVPSSLKKSLTGSGTASKEEMREALPVKVAQELSTDDEVDAYALAQVGASALGWPNLLVETANLKKVCDSLSQLGVLTS